MVHTRTLGADSACPNYSYNGGRSILAISASFARNSSVLSPIWGLSDRENL